MEILARAVGRRKEAVAQIQLVHGNGQYFINDKPAQAYLQNQPTLSLICIKSPLQAALTTFSNNNLNSLDVVNYEKKIIEKKKLEEQSDLLKQPDNRMQTEFTLTNDTINLEKQLLPLNESDELQSLNTPKQFLLSNLVSLDQIDVIIKVKGGGLIGQAEAIKLGIARAFCILENLNSAFALQPKGIIRKTLKTKGYLRQDSRVKERRKYGLKKARKASQYHKR